MAFPLPRARPRSSCKSVRVYKGLLLLSLLEGILWSLCLFHSASASGLAYYERETVNLKSTTASSVHRPLPVPALDTRALLLALRDEARARQRTLENSATLPAAREPTVQLAGLRAFLPLLGEQPSDSGADSAAAPALTLALAQPARRVR